MASPSTKFSLLSIFIFSISLSQLPSISATPTRKLLPGSNGNTQIDILNSVGEGLQVKVHCRGTQGDDKGDHVVEDGQTYDFEISSSPLAHTEYNCDLSFKNGGASVEVYSSSRDVARCPTRCHWMMDAGGIYGYNEAGKVDLLFDWGSLDES